MTPKVSVGMPVYNGERWLTEAVDSILAQSSRELELVICDNASTDGTERICRDYATRDSRVRYFRNSTNLGINDNYNLSFKLSKGEYFKWASCNDVCEPTLIERCSQVLDARPDVVLCYGRTGLLTEPGGTPRVYDDQLNLEQEDPRERLRELQEKIRLNNIMNGVMRAQVLHRTTLLGNYLSSDIVLMAELALHGKFVELPQQLFFRRMMSGAATRYRSAEELVEYFEPQRRKPLLFQHWKLHWGYCAAIARSPLTATARAGVFAELMRRAYWDRKGLALDVLVAARNLFVGHSGDARSMTAAGRGARNHEAG